ncbi:MAG: class II fructose-bisphosphate aldolase, partial [Caldicoprobacterales bacterium]
MMALVNPLKMIKKAQREGYAIAAFNIHNLETIQAVVEAAWEEQSPLIIQTTPGTLKHAGIPYVAACVKTAAELYDIPIALHLDHCESFETIVQCIRAGYTSVMIDSSKLPYHENVAAVKRVVDIAKLVDVAVEGEIGRIGGTEDDMTVDEREAALTIPEEAQEFAQA